MKKGVAVLSVVVLVVVATFITVSGFWYFFDKSTKTKSQIYTMQINQLESKIEALETENDSLKSGENLRNSGIEDQTDLEQKDLSTYNSLKYGYSFQYPSDFFLVDWFWDGQNNQKISQNGKVVWVSNQSLGDKAIPLDASPVSQYFAITVEEDALTGLSALRGDGTGVVITDATIGGIAGWKVLRTEVEEYSGNYTTTYYVNNNNNVYSIQIVNSDASGAHDAEIDAMVESFSFE